jgi:hypothetical protein
MTSNETKFNALMEISSIHGQLIQLGRKFGDDVKFENEEKSLAILLGHISDNEQIGEHISDLATRLDYLWSLVHTTNKDTSL